jgi:hypothetical protein
MMNRRAFAMTAGAALALAGTGRLKGDTTGMSYYQEIFAQSMNDKKGITVYAGGAAIVGVVVKINGGDTIEMRNREVSRIIVRVDRIDAVSIA